MRGESMKISGRRTSVDSVFDHLYGEIVSMNLLPGTKISEAEIAGMFSISRQPVRDAFSRLENMDLLLIRPQKATEVKRFSNAAITTARFVRAAVEAEALRRAARVCDEKRADRLRACIETQQSSVKSKSYDEFRSLDYTFHETLCDVGDVDFAFEVIAREKAKVDRLCVLGLFRDEGLGQLLEDHIAISEAVINNDEERAVEAGMLHLQRLDSTIETIRKEHSDYFDD